MGYVFSGQSEMFGERRAIGFEYGDFGVREIDRQIANTIIKQNHYSKKIVSVSFVHLGIFLRGSLLGVLQFGPAMNPASYASICANTGPDEYLELNRMWLCDSLPRNSESRALSCAIKYIRQAWPKVKWIQSFADQRCGALGVVYQACNFKYFGEHTSVFWTLDGETFHNSIATNGNRSHTASAKRLAAGIDRAEKNSYRQFRYIYFMKPRFLRDCLLKQKPYPKIATRPEDEQSTRLCEAGATPAGRSNLGAA